VPIHFLERLYDEIGKFQRKKKTREQLLNALGNEIESYVNAFDNLGKTGKEQLLPLLQSLAYKPPIPRINQIVNAMADMQIQFSKIIQSLMKLAEGCKQVSSYEAFMKHLMEADDVLYDFVKMMAKTVIDDTMLIDSNFYRFFKLHGDEITKNINATDIDKAVKELKFYIDIIKKQVKPHVRRAWITRKTLSYYIESCRELGKACKKVRIQKTRMIDLRYYVPSKLLPIVVLLEESFPLQ
jgi:hypothetical protein